MDILNIFLLLAFFVVLLLWNKPKIYTANDIINLKVREEDRQNRQRNLNSQRLANKIISDLEKGKYTYNHNIFFISMKKNYLEYSVDMTNQYLRKYKLEIVDVIARDIIAVQVTID